MIDLKRDAVPVLANWAVSLLTAPVATVPMHIIAGRHRLAVGSYLVSLHLHLPVCLGWAVVLATHVIGSLKLGVDQVSGIIGRVYLPRRWSEYLAAWRGFAMLQEPLLQTVAWRAAFCNPAASSDVTVPLVADDLFKTVFGEDSLAMALGNRIGATMALQSTTLVVPNWDVALELTPQRWKRWWECLATVPRMFGKEVETATLVAWKNFHAGKKGWSTRIALPNNTDSCVLCGEPDETFAHLLTQCPVSLMVYNAFTPGSPPPLSELVCPWVGPDMALKERAVHLRIFFLHTIVRWARSRRSSTPSFLERPPPDWEVRARIGSIRYSMARMGLVLRCPGRLAVDVAGGGAGG